MTGIFRKCTALLIVCSYLLFPVMTIFSDSYYNIASGDTAVVPVITSVILENNDENNNKNNVENNMENNIENKYSLTDDENEEPVFYNTVFPVNYASQEFFASEVLKPDFIVLDIEDRTLRRGEEEVLEFQMINIGNIDYYGPLSIRIEFNMEIWFINYTFTYMVKNKIFVDDIVLPPVNNTETVSYVNITLDYYNKIDEINNNNNYRNETFYCTEYGNIAPFMYMRSAYSSVIYVPLGETVDMSDMVIAANPVPVFNSFDEFIGYESDITKMDFFWDFGDGTVTTQQYPSHTYTQYGRFEVFFSGRDLSDPQRILESLVYTVATVVVTDFPDDEEIIINGEIPVNVVIIGAGTRSPMLTSNEINKLKEMLPKWYMPTQSIKTLRGAFDYDEERGAPLYHMGVNFSINYNFIHKTNELLFDLETFMRNNFEDAGLSQDEWEYINYLHYTSPDHYNDIKIIDARKVEDWLYSRAMELFPEIMNDFTLFIMAPFLSEPLDHLYFHSLKGKEPDTGEMFFEKTMLTFGGNYNFQYYDVQAAKPVNNESGYIHTRPVVHTPKSFIPFPREEAYYLEMLSEFIAGAVSFNALSSYVYPPYYSKNITFDINLVDYTGIFGLMVFMEIMEITNIDDFYFFVDAIGLPDVIDIINDINSLDAFTLIELLHPDDKAMYLEIIKQMDFSLLVEIIELTEPLFQIISNEDVYYLYSSSDDYGDEFFQILEMNSVKESFIDLMPHINLSFKVNIINISDINWEQLDVVGVDDKYWSQSYGDFIINSRKVTRAFSHNVNVTPDHRIIPSYLFIMDYFCHVNSSFLEPIVDSIVKGLAEATEDGEPWGVVSASGTFELAYIKGFTTNLIHEIGHILGFSHPHDGSPREHNNKLLMTYNNYENDYYQTPMTYVQAALTDEEGRAFFPPAEKIALYRGQFIQLYPMALEMLDNMNAAISHKGYDDYYIPPWIMERQEFLISSLDEALALFLERKYFESLTICTEVFFDTREFIPVIMGYKNSRLGGIIILGTTPAANAELLVVSTSDIFFRGQKNYYSFRTDNNGIYDIMLGAGDYYLVVNQSGKNIVSDRFSVGINQTFIRDVTINTAQLPQNTVYSEISMDRIDLINETRTVRINDFRWQGIYYDLINGNRNGVIDGQEAEAWLEDSIKYGAWPELSVSGTGFRASNIEINLINATGSILSPRNIEIIYNISYLAMNNISYTHTYEISLNMSGNSYWNINFPGEYYLWSHEPLTGPGGIPQIHIEGNRTVNINTVSIYAGPESFRFEIHKNLPPIANLFVPQRTVLSHNAVVFDASGSMDYEDGADILYRFDFGDGTDTGWITNSSITYNYTRSGTYMATLSVKDSHGSVGITVSWLNITNRPPVAAIFLIENDVPRNQKVIISGATSYDLDGDIVKYIFSLGDGTQIESEYPIINHTYKKAGTMTITLAVIDNLNIRSDITTASIRIVVPTIEYNREIKGVRGNELRFNSEPLLEYLYETGSIPSGETATRFRWDFGDGESSQQSNPIYIYSSIGMFRGTFTAFDGSGERHVLQFYVNVTLGGNNLILHLEFLLTPTIENKGAFVYIILIVVIIGGTVVKFRPRPAPSLKDDIDTAEKKEDSPFGDIFDIEKIKKKAEESTAKKATEAYSAFDLDSKDSSPLSASSKPVAAMPSSSITASDPVSSAQYATSPSKSPFEPSGYSPPPPVPPSKETTTTSKSPFEPSGYPSQPPASPSTASSPASKSPFEPPESVSLYSSDYSSQSSINDSSETSSPSFFEPPESITSLSDDKEKSPFDSYENAEEKIEEKAEGPSFELSSFMYSDSKEPGKESFSFENEKSSATYSSPQSANPVKSSSASQQYSSQSSIKSPASKTSYSPPVTQAKKKYTPPSSSTPLSSTQPSSSYPPYSSSSQSAYSSPSPSTKLPLTKSPSTPVKSSQKPKQPSNNYSGSSNMYSPGNMYGAGSSPYSPPGPQTKKQPVSKAPSASHSYSQQYSPYGQPEQNYYGNQYSQSPYSQQTPQGYRTVSQQQEVQCPSCSQLFVVADLFRPIIIQCPFCGTKGMLD